MNNLTKFISLIFIIPFAFSMCNNPKTEKSVEDNEPKGESVKRINNTPDLPINEESVNVNYTDVSGYFDFEKIPDNEYRIFADIDYNDEKVKISIPKIDVNNELSIYKGVYTEIENEWKFVVDIKVPEIGEEDVFSSNSYFEMDIDSFNQISTVLIRVFNDDGQTLKYCDKEIFKQSTFEYSSLSQTASPRVKELVEAPEDFFSFFNDEDAILVNSIIENTETCTVNIFELAFTHISLDSVKYDEINKDLIVEIAVTTGDSIEEGKINHYSFTINSDYYLYAKQLKVTVKKGDEKTSKTEKIDRKL